MRGLIIYIITRISINFSGVRLREALGGIGSKSGRSQNFCRSFIFGENRSRREWSRREPSDIDEARKGE